MKQANNIVTFPKLNSKIPPSEEEVDNNLDYLRFNHINETIEFIAPQLFQDLRSVGFDFDDDDQKEGAFLIESIRSLLCKHYGAMHPFQEISEKVFEEDDDGDFKIADSLNIIFSKDEDTKSEVEK